MEARVCGLMQTTFQDTRPMCNDTDSKHLMGRDSCDRFDLAAKATTEFLNWEMGLVHVIADLGAYTTFNILTCRHTHHESY